jgi:transcriptional regulator with XRE-family HTH domain
VSVASVHDQIRIADWAWQRPETAEIIRNRDMAGLLKFAQQYGGASQLRLSAATGIAQGRISEIINGKKVVSQLDVFTRIADGLNMPDLCRTALGLAPRIIGDRLAGGTTEISRHFTSQGPVAAEIRRRAADAQQLDILAVRALGIIALNDSLLRPALLARKTPLQVRVLLLDPDSQAARRRAEEIGEGHASFAAGIRLALAKLEDVRDAAPNVDLEVRLYDRLPVWRVLRIDDISWISSFDARWEGHESTIYEIPHTPRGSFWAGYRRQFEDLYDHANPVTSGAAQ